MKPIKLEEYMNQNYMSRQSREDNLSSSFKTSDSDDIQRDIEEAQLQEPEFSTLKANRNFSLKKTAIVQIEQVEDLQSINTFK